MKRYVNYWTILGTIAAVIYFFLLTPAFHPVVAAVLAIAVSAATLMGYIAYNRKFLQDSRERLEDRRPTRIHHLDLSGETSPKKEDDGTS